MEARSEVQPTTPRRVFLTHVISAPLVTGAILSAVLFAAVSVTQAPLADRSAGVKISAYGIVWLVGTLTAALPLILVGSLPGLYAAMQVRSAGAYSIAAALAVAILAGAIGGLAYVTLINRRASVAAANLPMHVLLSALAAVLSTGIAAWLLRRTGITRPSRSL